MKAAKAAYKHGLYRSIPVIGKRRSIRQPTGKRLRPAKTQAAPVFGRRITAYALLVSVALALVCIPLATTVVRQVRLMIPGATVLPPRDVLISALAALRQQPEVGRTIRQFQILAQRNPSPDEITQWRQSDPTNALPAWAEILVELRTLQGPASSQPALDTHLLSLLQAVPSEPPLRLHAATAQRLMMADLREHDLSAREAALVADVLRWQSPDLVPAYREVIRELTKRLLLKVAAHRQHSQPDAAITVYATLKQMLTQVVDDSPLPDIALLGTERLPAILTEWAHTLDPDIERSGSESRNTISAPATTPVDATAQDLLRQAKDVERFRSRLRDFPDEQLNLMPPLGTEVVAQAAQDRALRWMTLAGLTTGAAGVLAVICLGALAIILLRRPPATPSLAWGWRGHGYIAGAAFIVLSWIVLLGGFLFLLYGLSHHSVPYVWLFSRPSWSVAAILPASLVCIVAIATRLAVENPREPQQGLVPPMAIIDGVLFIILFVVALLIAIPLHPEPWRPPAGIQILRRAGKLAGLACIPVLAFWLIWGIRRRRRAGWPAGAYARATLAVTSVALAVMLLLSTVMLGTDRWADAVHDRAFAKGIVAPIADLAGK